MLLNDEVQANEHVTELQTRLNKYEEEARTLRAEAQYLKAERELLFEKLETKTTLVSKMDRFITELALVTGADLKQLVRISGKVGMRLNTRVKHKP